MTAPISPDRAAFVYIGAFVDELARSGVRHVCIAPGSRSTPLALTIARHPALRTWMHLDERSAAFFALGLARITATPVAVLCTSGTATANLLPAVVEARAAAVPLLVLTADRPPELRDVGAAQTIDQTRLYGTHAKWFVDVALPEATPELLRYVRTLACRATALASAAPAGPVHLNFPFREPLVPVALDAPANLDAADALAWRGRAEGAPWVAVEDPAPAAESAVVARLAGTLRSAKRPLIVCGPQPDPTLAVPLAQLASTLDAPLLADPLSQLRWGAHDRCAVVDRYDATLRDEATASSLAPDVIVRIGAIPTSKPLLQYLQRHATARQIVVDAARWPDPLHTAATVVHADPRTLCDQLCDQLRNERGTDASNSDDWLATWRAIDVTADRALRRYVDSLGAEPFDGRALADVAAAIPDGGTLMVSSSMPVRDLDSFARGDGRALRVLANRGANGIDGVISTALGGAAGTRDVGGAPLVLVLGDLAFYHDMNGLLAARLHALDATVVVVNNDGGGIFSFLPQAAEPEHFEHLFGTPHGLGFAQAAAMYGAAWYTHADTHEALRDAIAAGVRGRGLHIVELRTDRARNVTLHRDAWRAVAEALGSARETV